MGITSRMNERYHAVRESVQDKLYREERAFRADKLVEKWSRIPEVGTNIKKMSETDARNLAIHLENQARYLSRLTEAQLSTQFQGLSPENMLRLVRLSFPNTIRNKLFTEFAMESAKDSIKYIRPVYTNTQSGKDLNIKTFENDWNLNGSNDINQNNFRKAMYNQTEDRYASELVNGEIFTPTATTTVVNNFGSRNLTAGNTYVIFGEFTKPAGSGTVTVGTVFRERGYLDGYSSLYGDITAANYQVHQEQEPLAIQIKTGASTSNTGQWLVKSGLNITITELMPGVYEITGTDANKVKKAIGRFNSEADFDGDYLGEVELVMSDYWFKPRPTSIGITFSQMTEIVLDASFGVSAEEMMVEYGAQEIKKSLDYRAVRIAYQAAKMNGIEITFDAAAGNSSDDSYLHTAQTFEQAIERVGDVMYNKLNMGGVSRIVGGPAAISYLRLNTNFTTKGAQARLGGHQVGELGGIPVFKVPSSVIPDNEILCIWKNDQNEADVSIAFGTLIPFFSTGVIQRKNFYKEAGLASYGDYAVLNRHYLGVIKINNLRQLQQP